MARDDRDRSDDKIDGGEDDQTVVRTKSRASAEDDTVGDHAAVREQVDADEATVIRGEETSSPERDIGADDATEMRAAEAPPELKIGANDATVIRGAQAPPEPEIGADDATVIRGAKAPPEPEIGADDATVIRGAEAPPEPQIRADDATVIRGDDRATISKPTGADDPTVMNTGDTIGAEEDTTYIAAVGNRQVERDTSSQAGRLLKNRFVLEEKLGSGGMGDIYKALDLRQQEAQDRNPYVAIKLLNERFGRHKDAFISLQREASKTRSMHSKNIMGVYDFDREGETFFMAMELLDGEPLDDFLKSHPEGVSHEDAWNIIRGYCEGLQAAHAENIVHSDFKPGNIYYTKDKVAKVFDFGIARAVQNPGTSQEGKEETLFDPGSLGALTPTYASYEMLTGGVPSKSDDVYAAALVAYELFTGRHPYNRVPADKALAQGLEPEPVAFLKRRHWRALRKGLALTGEERTPTIDEFMEGMFSEDPPILRYSIIGVVLAAIIGFSTYAVIFAPETNQGLIAEQSQLQLRKDDFTALVKPKTEQARQRMFTDAWTQDVSNKLQEMYTSDTTLVEQYSQPPDPEIVKFREDVTKMHIDRIQQLREAYSAANEPSDPEGNLQQAEVLLDRVKQFFNFDDAMVRSADLALGDAIKLRDLEKKRIADAKAAADEAARVEAERIRREEDAKKAQEQQMADYNTNAKDLLELYKCKKGISDLNQMSNDIRNLKRIDPERFAKDRTGIVGGIAQCIDRTKIKNPDDARKIQAAGLALFPEDQLLASITISALDPCAKTNLIGTGARPRSQCKDDLTDGGTGPELVVIPETKGIPMFAVSRTEIKVGDYNAFCEATGCARLPGSPSMPVTEISVQQARAYMAWLSDQSGRRYRLPTVEEWKYAAKTDEEGPVDPNVNCTVESRGVRLGESLVSALSGKPNRWGLYNEIGNAQEWATDGESLEALGGAHTDPKAECTPDMVRAHSGEPDAVTGFRVLRELSGNS